MRTFELTTRLDEVRRSEGRSATASAAYISGTDIHCEKDDKTHAYSRKGGVTFSAILTPGNAPSWAKNREKLWNAAELAEKNGKRGKNAGQWKAKAQTATTYLFSFPAELSAAGRQAVAQAIGRYLVERDGTAADVNIHAPGREGDERNWHCHIQMPTRVLSAKGLGKKVAGRNDLKLSRRQAKAWRAFVAEALNDQLKAEGKADLVKVEHKSFKDRGLQRTPSRHQGVARTNMQRKERRLARDAWAQTQQSGQAERHAKELANLKLKQGFAMQQKRAELARRYRALRQALRQELAEAREQDRIAGVKRAFLIVAGRLAKADFDRQQRHAERVAAAKARLDTLKTTLRIEERTFHHAQTLERDQLEERHAAENRQLTQAAMYREGLDRSRERQTRQPPQHERQQEHEQGRELRLEL